MGQQQLLLIILGLIIIGVAVVVGVGMFQDNAVDHNRALVIADLKILGAKAQHYYTRPMIMGGGNKSFVGLIADEARLGIGMLAATKYTDNANGKYSIKEDGTETSVTLVGVGKVAMSDSTFAEYELVVTLASQTLTRIR